MAAELASALVGLALLDSLNTSTLFMVMVVLLMARRPGRSGVAYAIGATLSFFGLAVGLYSGASAAEAIVVDLARWLRRVTFSLLAIWLLYLAFRRLRDRPRKPLVLPAWFGPATALPIGALATVADLPNAFPLFIAVERLVSAQLSWPVAVFALGAYVVVYALPIGLVLVLGMVRGQQARARMRKITDRFLTGVALRSAPVAAVFGVAAAGSAALVFVV